jgi:hypothetical protein
MGSPQTEKVKRYRRRLGERVKRAMGGCCKACGYDQCNEALELHHIDPTQKDVSFSTFRSTPRAISTLIAELKKCVLLCANCHRKVHAGKRESPTLTSFSEGLFGAILEKQPRDVKGYYAAIV